MNWPKINILLKSHESITEHRTHMATWTDFELFTNCKDNRPSCRTLLEAEKRRWRDLLHFISIIQYHKTLLDKIMEIS